MEQYYYYDGTEVLGPHNPNELQELLADRAITQTTPVFPVGAKDWVPLSSFPELFSTAKSSPEPKPSHREIEALNGEQQVVATPPNEEEKASQVEDEQEIATEKTKRLRLISKIRQQLDELWKCQREAIIARIRDEDLDGGYKLSQDKQTEIYKTIEGYSIDYWRRSGLLKWWIEELTWQDGGRSADYSHRLQGSNEQEKYNDLQDWLEHRGLSDLDGCYCFKKDKSYLYVGQGRILRERIKQHERTTFFTYADSIRVIIPRNKRHLNKLERLLILTHQPKENKNGGVTGNNAADDCLAYVLNEIEELMSDWD